MHRHYSALGKCFFAALIASICTQLSSTAGFIRWSAIQGNNYSAEFWDLTLSTWHQDGLTMFLIWATVSLIIYFIIARLTTHQETAEKIMTRLSFPIVVIYSLILYQSFKDYL